jgi:acetyl-CoA carboxylase biotin carboxyl carrier protein
MASRKEQLEGSAARRGKAKATVEGEQPAASVNMDELRELIALLHDNGLAELELERPSFRVRLRKEGAITPSYAPEQVIAAPAPRQLAPPLATATTTAAPTHPGAQAETAASEDQDLHIITSPIVGTFYRSPSPTAEAFVKIGSNVEPDTVVCIIEAMKLMNEIQAEAGGEVVKIYVENGQPVEYGQPLFGIKS